jgi:D-alanyl-D-alanine carboxypeptidase
VRQRRFALSLLLLTVLCGLPLAAEPPEGLPERIGRIIERPEFRHAFWGIEFLDLETDKPVYELNADKLFTPGSTTKLLTEGTALALLGGDYRFKTRIYRTGDLGADGVLTGDLVLVAGGDPNLSGRIRPDDTLAFEDEDHSYGGDPSTRAVPGDPLLVIRKLAAQVAARGIRTVRGRVRVDISLFPEGERELGTGLVLSPVMINDNVVDVTIGPGTAPDAPAVLNASPATSYVRFVHQVKTGPVGSRPAVDSSADTANADGTHTVTLTGTFPMGTAPILYAHPVPEPSRLLRSSSPRCRSSAATGRWSTSRRPRRPRGTSPPRPARTSWEIR